MPRLGVPLLSLSLCLFLSRGASCRLFRSIGLEKKLSVLYHYCCFCFRAAYAYVYSLLLALIATYMLYCFAFRTSVFGLLVAHPIALCISSSTTREMPLHRCFAIRCYDRRLRKIFERKL